MKVQLLFALCVVLTGPTVFAEAPENLVNALKALSESPTVAMTGYAGKKFAAPQDDHDDVVVQQIVVGVSKKFQGNIEFYRDADDHVALRSTDKGMPQFGYFDNGGEAITAAKFTDEFTSISSVVNDLTQLTDWRKLIRAVVNSKSIKTATRDGATDYTVELTKRLIRAQGGADEIMAPKLIGLQGVFEVDHGKVIGITFILAQSSPIADLIAGGGGDVKFQGDVEGLDQLSPDQRKRVLEGIGGGSKEKPTIYRMKITPPSAEIQAVIEDLEVEIEP